MPSLSMYCSRGGVPGPSAIVPVKLFLAVAASGVFLTSSHLGDERVGVNVDDRDSPAADR